MEHRSWGSAENSLRKSLERITVALTTCLIRSRLSSCTEGMKIRPLSPRRTQLLICRLLLCPGGGGCGRTFSCGWQACGTPLGHQNKESTWVPWWQLRKSGPERHWQGPLWKVPDRRWGGPRMARGGGRGRWHRPPGPFAGLPSQRDLRVSHQHLPLRLTLRNSKGASSHTTSGTPQTQFPRGPEAGKSGL